MSTTEGTSPTYLNHEPTYHNNKSSAYVLPNDAPEHIRLEEQAKHLSAVMNNQIIHSPLDPKIQNSLILDVGCGTGIVTDHLGTRFPSAKVYGLDLSPVPQLRPHPPNVKFLQGNILTDKPNEWSPPLQDSSFDLIFSRLLVCGLTDWPGYISKSYQLLKPGGFLEVHDIDWIWYNKFDEIISEDWKWLTACRTIGEEKGMDLAHCASKAKGRMERAGFVDVRVEEYRWPHGGEWETEEVWRAFGEYVAEYIPPLIRQMVAKMLEGKGYKEEEVGKMQDEVLRTLGREEGKYWVFKVTVGRKPVG